MTMKMTEKKEIMRLFNKGDFESRKEAITMLYKGFSGYYLMVIKRELILNKYDVYSPEEVLSDIFLGLLSKKINPSSVFTIEAWLKSYVLNVTRNFVKNIPQRVTRNLEYMNA